MQLYKPSFTNRLLLETNTVSVRKAFPTAWTPIRLQADQVPKNRLDCVLYLFGMASHCAVPKAEAGSALLLDASAPPL